MKKITSYTIQFSVVALIIILFLVIARNITHNLHQQNLTLGFDFLDKPAGFAIIQTLLPYKIGDSYLQVFKIGVMNTLLVFICTAIFSTIFGFIIALGRLSVTPIIRIYARLYVEIFRNIPLLLWVFFFYKAVLAALPPVENSLIFFDAIFLNQRGIYLPWNDVPMQGRFNIEGGIELLPEFLALVIALSFYTAAFIAENIRAGVLSVPKGQSEAAFSLGLPHFFIFRKIIFPQAFPAIKPVMTNQYLNLMKNSSLAAAIGYPDLVQIFAGTSLNQTGQAVEIIFMTMSVYLFFSLLISVGMRFIRL